jgi:hypothetical protein
MADDALKRIKTLLESLPVWIADIEGILKSAVERQQVLLQEKQPTESPITAKRRRRSSATSLCTRPEEDVKVCEEPRCLEQVPGDQALLRPQLPHLTDSDALRLSQRKRKTSSACSIDRSGPRQYRSRGMVVIYYDGDTQKELAKLVRDLAFGRNDVRKGKPAATPVPQLWSASSGDDASGSDEDDVLELGKLKYKSSRPASADLTSGNQGDITAMFDNVDRLLDKAQSLSEKAAHQVLRDGDCALELNNAKRHLILTQKAAEAELPKLEKRAEDDAGRRRRSNEKRQAREVRDERQGDQVDVAPHESPVPSLVSATTPEDGKLEVDLEPDDTDGGDSGDLTPGGVFQLSKYQMRSSRLLAH